MSTAITHYKRLKDIFINKEEILSKHNGFLPFEVLDLKNEKKIYKDNFVTEHHPFILEGRIGHFKKIKFSKNIVKFSLHNSIILEKYRYEYHNFLMSILESIFLIISKKSNHHYIDKQNYEKFIYNMQEIFFIDNFQLIIFKKKYLKYFVNSLKILRNFKKKYEIL